MGCKTSRQVKPDKNRKWNKKTQLHFTGDLKAGTSYSSNNNIKTELRLNKCNNKTSNETNSNVDWDN